MEHTYLSKKKAFQFKAFSVRFNLSFFNSFTICCDEMTVNGWEKWLKLFIVRKSSNYENISMKTDCVTLLTSLALTNA